LHATLTNIDDPEEVVRQLIDLANRGGGPDNITCVLADVVEFTDGQQVPTEAAIVGAAGMTRLRHDPHETSPGQPGAVTAPQPVLTDDDFDEPGPQAARRPVKRRRAWPMLVSVLGVAVVAIGVGGYFGWQWTQDQFFVGAKGDEVVVFRGIRQEVGPFQFFSVAQHSGKPLSQLSAPDQALIKGGIDVTNVAEGVTRINGFKATAEPTDQKAAPTENSSPTASPTKTKAKPQ
ncbi:MAG TPA: serine/threonine-protein phosphatase, partial [Nonomuraea sp.]|nr:serine/threonine-protein phosphatase [Nonomuraea sp.]